MKRAEKKRVETAPQGKPFEAHKGVAIPTRTALDLIKDYQRQMLAYKEELEQFDESGFSKQKKLDKLFEKEKKYGNYNLDLYERQDLEKLRFERDTERHFFIKELKNKYHRSFDLDATLAVGASIGHAAEQSVLPEGVSLQQHLSALQKDLDEAQADHDQKSEVTVKLYEKQRELTKRLEQGEQVEPEELDKVAAELTSSRRIVSSAFDKVLQMEENQREFGRKLSEAYLNELRKIRSFGGSVQWSKLSDKKAVKVFDEALQYYPSDWIEHSNQSTEMVAKELKTRAHYQHAGAVTKKFETQKIDEEYNFNSESDKNKFIQKIANNPEYGIVEKKQTRTRLHRQRNP